MRYKKLFLLAITIAFTMTGFTGCGGEPSIRSVVSTLNKSLEKSYDIESGSINTNILEGSFSPKDAAENIKITFSTNEENKDKNATNLNFYAIFTYPTGTKEIENITSHDGVYLNALYPYTKYNKLNKEDIESVTVNEIEGGTEYYVYYNKTHFSRREEWEYCKVSKDIEYFLVDEEGVIIKYSSDTYFEKQEEKTSQWVDGQSKVIVELTEYTLKK